MSFGIVYKLNVNILAGKTHAHTRAFGASYYFFPSAPTAFLDFELSIV
jgi:hypothetical protein